MMSVGKGNNTAEVILYLHRVIISYTVMSGVLISYPIIVYRLIILLFITDTTTIPAGQ